MAIRTLNPNMGKSDRLIRGVLGGLLLLNGLPHMSNSRFGRLESLVGGIFLAYGLTGFDPILRFFNASTIPGAENHVFNLLKQVAPGQGINPMLTQQAIPRCVNRTYRTDQTFAQVTTIP